MAINRVEGAPFAQIANEALRDRRLSYRARGILAMVLSHSEEWEAGRDWLVEQSDKDGREAVQSALNELRELGYRQVTKEQAEDGSVRTVVVWGQFPNPDGRVSRRSGKPADGETGGRKTRRSIKRTQLTENNLQNTIDIRVEPEPQRLSDRLADHIEAQGVERPKVSPRWIRDMTRLHRADGKPWDVIAEMIDWCQADHFWKSVILSPDGLRKNWNRMELQRRRDQPITINPHLTAEQILGDVG